ncbi:TRL-like family protein [Parabacteroides goldsteinii]|jgi:lipoprotein|nr:TRL-like family protein [Parabacteroides goldsteinii]
MKKIIAFCSAVLLLSSCAMVKSPVTGFVYTGTKSPVTVTENPVGSKKGEASTVSVLGWFAVGDASVQKAAKEAGITKISHVDEESTSVLGLFAKYTITVYGE